MVVNKLASRKRSDSMRLLTLCLQTRISWKVLSNLFFISESFSWTVQNHLLLVNDSIRKTSIPTFGGLSRLLSIVSGLIQIVIINIISILIHSLSKIFRLNLHLWQRYTCLIFHRGSSFILFRRAVVIVGLDEILLWNHHWLSVLMSLLLALSEFGTDVWARSWLHLDRLGLLLSHSI